MIFDTLLGLWGIETNMYDSRQDLSSSSYGFNKDNVLSESGTKFVRDDSYNCATK